MVSNVTKLRHRNVGEKAPETPDRPAVQLHTQRERVDIKRFAEQLKAAQEAAQAAHDRAAAGLPPEKTGTAAMTPEQRRRLYGSSTDTTSQNADHGEHRSAQDEA